MASAGPPDTAGSVDPVAATGLRALLGRRMWLLVWLPIGVFGALHYVTHADLHWVDIHHSSATKGGAIEVLKDMLGVERVICFGDNDNDLSMFALADESYAPRNANDSVKAAATSASPL